MRVSIGDTAIWFDVDGAKLAVGEDGMVERPTILALHGGPGFDHAYLKPELQDLASLAQVVFMDQRGQGRSDPSASEHWNLARWADDVAAFCRALGIERPILLGHSFGGMVAFATAARHPDLASGLVILSSAAYFTREESIARFEELGGPEVADAARQAFARPEDEQAFATFGRLCFPLYHRGPPDGRLARCIMRPAVRTHFFVPEGEFGRLDYRAALRACRTPTLMLHGAWDPIIPPAAAEATAAAFPSGVAKLIVYEDASHQLMADSWKDVFRAISAFVRDLGRPNA